MKRQIAAILLGILGLGAEINAQDISFDWVKQIGGTRNQYILQADLDSASNVVYTGFLWGNVDFDPGPGTYTLSSTTPNSFFIAKIDSGGNFMWAKQVGGSSGYVSSGYVKLDQQANIFVTGVFRGTVDFDPGVGVSNLTSPNSNDDVFFAKYDPLGNLLWAKRIGGNADDSGYVIKLDSQGNILLSGQYEGTVDFDPGPGVFNLSSVGTGNLFASKYDSAGNLIWAKRFVGSGEINGFDMAIDQQDNIHLGGGLQRYN
jgi:hypothetical protein